MHGVRALYSNNNIILRHSKESSRSIGFSRSIKNSMLSLRLLRTDGRGVCDAILEVVDGMARPAVRGHGQAVTPTVVPLDPRHLELISPDFALAPG